MVRQDRIATKRNRIVTSISAYFIHDVEERFALPEPLEVIQKELHSALLPVGRMVGGVRGEQHVLELVEGMAGRQRLNIENIEGRAANALALQCVHQGPLVHY